MSSTKSDIAVFALGLIARKNYSSFSYDDIAREFGMTKAAVHYHFKNKEDLGVAICELFRDRILALRAEWIEACRGGRHPWRYIEERIGRLPSGVICPIVSMQADFENLPESLRLALKEVTATEIETLRILAKAYREDVDADSVTLVLLGLKGAMQYRRVMGEPFFQKMMKTIKAQFHAVVPKGNQGE